MDSVDFRAHLTSDYSRLTAVATDLTATVPSCPGWTVEDLIRHVAEVYLHKGECMRLGHTPANWPPDLSAEPALDSLARSYTDLTTEFDARSPESPSYTWCDPDQTVGFWIRRMAQETV